MKECLQAALCASVNRLLNIHFIARSVSEGILDSEKIATFRPCLRGEL